ncbi:MAG TPA: aldolase/citrate lyase family protein [Lacipirellulaceae bacterium]|nr:aldolase/citrate lyase family protein [Lacipirellulaceae bacterium]
MFEAIARFRQKLAAKELCLGAGITLADPAIVEALAPCVDFVWIDLEHSHLSHESVLAHLIAARAGNIAALVRVPDSDLGRIKPILDIGADGIIVPQVRTATEVRKIVDLSRYAPLGHRGYGPRRPAEYGRRGGREFMDQSNQHLFVAVQIENQDALEAVEDIAAVEGLDSLALGPYDLSVSLGHAGDLGHADVIAAITRVVNAAQRGGKHMGTGMGAYANDALAAVHWGIQWIQCGDDYGYMVAHAEALMSGIRSQMGAKPRSQTADPTFPR